MSRLALFEGVSKQTQKRLSTADNFCIMDYFIKIANIFIKN